MDCRTVKTALVSDLNLYCHNQLNRQTRFFQNSGDKTRKTVADGRKYHGRQKQRTTSDSQPDRLLIHQFRQTFP